MAGYRRRGVPYVATAGRLLAVVALALLCLVWCEPLIARADEALRVDDRANLFTREQERQLQEKYADLSQYCDAGLLTIGDDGHASTERYARDYVNGEFGQRAAIVFVIDVHLREIWVYANEAGLRIVSRADARAIADNVYQHASGGAYFACADEAFGQIRDLCAGRDIARPVKHITNALIALVLGILVNYGLAALTRSRAWHEDEDEPRLQPGGEIPKFVVDDLVLREVKRMNSGGGGDYGGDYGGGGGFSGGGFSDGGGGGGHSF